MSVINRAVSWAVNIANDASHGYDQTNRWGPDYDCSTLVISAWEQAGVPVKSAGATFVQNMYNAFISCGFTDITKCIDFASGSGLRSGDVLIKNGHTEMMCSTTEIVGAAGNENGGATGGETGDQTGDEIRIRSYYNGPWAYALRYTKYNEPFKWVADNRSLTDEEKKNNAAIIYRYFIRRGWSINAIAAMLGNFEYESSISPGRWQIGYTPGDLSAGYGLAQWTKAQKYVDYAGDDWETNHDKQLDFLQYHLQNPNVHWILRGNYTEWSFPEFAVSTEDPYTLACVFAWNYEGPAVVIWGAKSYEASLELTEEEKEANQEALRQQRGNAAVKWYEYLKTVPVYGQTTVPLWLFFKLKERSF